jgi:hypothetical protein
MQPEITPEYLASQGLSETFAERFWSKVNKTDGCWLWTGAKKEWGYGVIGSTGKRIIRANRASWIINRGPIPKGLWVLHRCDNPPCVNPDHLWLGNGLENMQDAARKGRMNQGENHGMSKLTTKQVLEMKSLYKKWAKNQAWLAAKFGISVFTLRRICYGTTWKHTVISADI